MKSSLRDKALCIVMVPFILLFMLCGLAAAGLGTLLELMLDKVNPEP